MYGIPVSLKALSVNSGSTDGRERLYGHSTPSRFAMLVPR